VADFPPAVAAGADAVLAATVFHYGTLRVGEVKAALNAAGYPVRRTRAEHVQAREAGPSTGSGRRTAGAVVPQ
jgi:hypothetical protein